MKIHYKAKIRSKILSNTRQEEQWSKIKKPETVPHIDGQVVNDKGDISEKRKRKAMGKMDFSINGVETSR